MGGFCSRDFGGIFEKAKDSFGKNMLIRLIRHIKL